MIKLHGQIFVCLCVGILMEGCATLPELEDDTLEDIRRSFHEKRCGEHCENTKINELFATCVLEWNVQSAKSPGMVDVGILAAGLGAWVEVGSITASIPIFVHAGVLRPLTRKRDRERYVYYCLTKNTGLMPGKSEIEKQEKKRKRKSQRAKRLPD